jgi:hypothetical protein
MFESVPEEIGHWAERCHVWAQGARTQEQRSMLQNLERLLDQAAAEAQRDLDLNTPIVPGKC